MCDYFRRCWAEVDLDCLALNLKQFKKRLSNGCRLMAVVKADAYGHGDIHIVRRLVHEGVDWFR